jgi:hypothetical protein
LHQIDRSAAAVFGCHAELAAPGQPSTSALRLRPDAQDDGRLTAAELLADQDSLRRYPLPRTVVVLGCESADVTGAVGGEWLTLGPALLWAGADEALVTLFPLFDDAPAEQDLMALLVTGIGLRADVVRWQLECLAAWRSAGEAWYSPLHWAGHSIVGVTRTGGGRPIPPDRGTHASVGDVARDLADVLLPPLSQRSAGVLLFCVKTARELRQEVVTTGHLAWQYLDGESEMFQTHLLMEVAGNYLSAAVVKLLRRESGPPPSGDGPGPSRDLSRLVDRARRRAAEMGSPTTMPAHLMLELLDGPYPDGLRVLRALRLARRQSFRQMLLQESRETGHAAQPLTDRQEQHDFIQMVSTPVSP